MKGTATLFRSGILAAGILSITSVAWGCDKSGATGSACSASKAAAAAPACCSASKAAAATPACCAASKAAATTAACPASKTAAATQVSPAPATAASPAPAKPGAAAQTAPAAAGMRAYIDPETGVVGSPGPLPPLTEEETKLLQPTVQEEPVETVLPDGSVMLDLKGRGQEYYILQLDANGKPVARCVEDPKTALQSPPAAQPGDR